MHLVLQNIINFLRKLLLLPEPPQRHDISRWPTLFHLGYHFDRWRLLWHRNKRLGVKPPGPFLPTVPADYPLKGRVGNSVALGQFFICREPRGSIVRKNLFQQSGRIFDGSHDAIMIPTVTFTRNFFVVTSTGRKIPGRIVQRRPWWEQTTM